MNREELVKILKWAARNVDAYERLRKWFFQNKGLILFSDTKCPAVPPPDGFKFEVRSHTPPLHEVYLVGPIVVRVGCSTPECAIVLVPTIDTLLADNPHIAKMHVDIAELRDAQGDERLFDVIERRAQAEAQLRAITAEYEEIVKGYKSIEGLLSAFVYAVYTAERKSNES